MKPKGTLVPNGGQFHKRWTASTGVILIQAPLLVPGQAPADPLGSLIAEPR